VGGYEDGRRPVGYGYPVQGYQQPGPVAYGQAPVYGQPARTPGYYMGRPLAIWGARFAAHLVDGLIAAIPTLVALPVLVVVAVRTTTTYPDGTISGPSALFVVLLLLAYTATLAVSLYNSVFLQGRTGQTWGKRMLKLRLVSMRDGQPLGPGMAFVRGLAHALDIYSFYVGYLWPIWDDLRQTFADKVCKTVVLSEG
jgi:uncharacterized RDD family membrane protein YckC